MIYKRRKKTCSKRASFFVSAHTVDMWEMQGLQTELVEIRRYLHKHAEVGFDLKSTAAYIEKKLIEYGYAPVRLGSAIVATVGEKGKTFLLHADMDAAMLLGAAKLLKAREKELNGRVKLLFQPAEECLEGAKDAIEKGVLEKPKPQAAMMIHVMTGVPFPAGTAVVAKGVSAPAADFFSISVQGKGCHGAAPWNGVDALSVAARILLGLEEISAREVSTVKSVVLTVGKLETEGADNVIADRAVLKGTLRSFDEETRKRVKERVENIARHIATAFQAKAQVSYHGGCPTLVNDDALSQHTEEVLREYFGKTRVYNSESLGRDVRAGQGGSEDFAYFTHKIPCVMMAVSAGEREKGYVYPLHHPKVAFDEKVLSIGATMYAMNAYQWLKKDGG